MTTEASATPRPAYLIAGANGMLGTALQRVLTERGQYFMAPPEELLDITDLGAIMNMIAAFQATLEPGQAGVFVNAAAYTNVEGAEDDADAAFRVNQFGPHLLSVSARNAGLRFVHISTDFVFDGKKDGAYTEDDETNPLSIYGESKLGGEEAVHDQYREALIVRTAWVFGENGVNFPVKILDAARTRPELTVVTDEVGSPTYTYDLATGILDLVDANASGLFHLAGSGSCSRFELAQEIVRLAGLDTPILPVTSDTFESKATRPLNSRLDCSKAAALGVTMPEWHDSLARFLAQIGATS